MCLHAHERTAGKQRAGQNGELVAPERESLKLLGAHEVVVSDTRNSILVDLEDRDRAVSTQYRHLLKLIATHPEFLELHERRKTPHPHKVVVVQVEHLHIRP